MNPKEHKLKIPQIQLMTKTSPYRKSGMQWKTSGIKKPQEKP
jgi:hypothetical protein